MRDISQPLHAAVPVWPGEPPFALHSHAVIGDGCPVNVGAMFTPLHAGTHGDAPLHYANDGVSRSEEHTSELPSLMRNSYAVFCLKQKTHNTLNQSTTRM